MYNRRSRWMWIVHIFVFTLYLVVVACSVWHIHIRRRMHNRLGGVHIRTSTARAIVCVNHPQMLECMFVRGYNLDTRAWYPDPRLDASTLASYDAVWKRWKLATPCVSINASVCAVHIDSTITTAVDGKAFAVVCSMFPHGRGWGVITGDCVSFDRSVSTAEDDQLLLASLRWANSPLSPLCYWCTEDRCVVLMSSSGDAIQTLNKTGGSTPCTVYTKCRDLIEHSRYGHSICVADRWENWISAPIKPLSTHMCVMRRGGVIMGGCMTAPGDRLFRVVLVIPLR